ncbi:MAG TPA: hypothetical protein VG895_04950 [Patescibacteria group bacterium]|nr:hypothetical protein [Patescibacteria group bacterium]
MKKYFWILVGVILLFGFITRIFIIQNNNLYFTADEGRDAVYVREILNSHALFTKGPQSSVAGLYTGPLWYYFISIGYVILKGSPYGSVLMLIILNLGICLALIYEIQKEINKKIALITLFGLMIFWPFFNTSLYGFNPFPLVVLSIILILFLVKEKYRLALIPILLAFNTELAGAVVFLLFYILVGFYLVLYKKISRRNFLVFAFIIPAIGLIKIITDYIRAGKNPSTGSGLKVFLGTNFKQIFVEFVKIIGSVTIPQNYILGLILTIAIVIVYLKRKHKKEFTKRFVYLTLFLIFVSYLFFGSNHGWREWHTVYLPVITLVATLLMCYELKNKTGKLFIFGILFLNIVNFSQNYINYLKPSNDRSLLYNQEKAIDWIYRHNENNGFDLYTYTDSFYDYGYQYLISWYGLPKYGFYPCEYSNFPLSHKYLYIPVAEKYNSPTLGCDKFRFLIVDSKTNGNENKNWINDFREQTILVDETKVGNIEIEKRKVPDKIR